MKLIRTEDAVGHVLCHDITQIINTEDESRGIHKCKGPVFRKGHVVTQEDVPVLLSVGKEHLYVWEKSEGILHEDEAAEILRDLCLNTNMHASTPSEGKIEITAECDGLLKIDSNALRSVNSTPQMMIATRHGNTPVKCGDKLAGTRIIPLVIEQEKMLSMRERVLAMSDGAPILHLMPYAHKKVGIVTTGSEVYKGRIKDTFTPVLIKKMEEFDVEIAGHIVCDDDDKKTTAAILELIEKGADLVLCTGGMSVDPDDRTPLAIRNTGAEIISYGAPVLPGAMFLVSYLHRKNEENTEETVIPVLGLPGCVMYAKRTIFDILLPRIMADDPITAEDIADLGEGGLCLGCSICTWPNCGFGK